MSNYIKINGINYKAAECRTDTDALILDLFMDTVLLFRDYELDSAMRGNPEMWKRGNRCLMRLARDIGLLERVEDN